ncbi:MAG: hypothetical protein OXE46_08465 [Chloroflexi bacterium]|nr:hypothetical protein [Chloroflexota bacterium]
MSVDRICHRHKKARDSARTDLDEVICRLPKNQGRPGRHKCPYCAYELGFAAGVLHAADALREMLLRIAQTDEVP